MRSPASVLNLTEALILLWSWIGF